MKLVSLLLTSSILTSGSIQTSNASPQRAASSPSAITEDDTTVPVVYSDIPYGLDPAQVMDIYVPSGNANGITIVLIHGGGWISGGKSNLQKIAAQLATDGFTVANINYRLATATANQYPTGILDAESAVQFLVGNATLYGIDPSRLAAFGTSAGANLALELGLANFVQAVVDFYGPTDLADPTFLADTYDRELNSDIVATYMGATLTDDPELYSRASPLDNVTAAMPPTIIFQGELDNVVPIYQALRFSQSLFGLGVVSQLEIEPTLSHGFLTNPAHDPLPYIDQSETFLLNNLPASATP